MDRSALRAGACSRAIEPGAERPGRGRRSTAAPPFAVAADLGAVPADLHVAPAAGAVAGAVVEGPEAVVGGTDLEPLPAPVGHGSVDPGQDAAKRSGHARRVRLHRAGAVAAEGELQLCLARGLAQPLDRR